MTIRALKVARGRIEPIELSDASASQEIHDAIGDFFSTAFTVWLGTYDDDRIVGFCDDQFLLKDPDAVEWSAALGLTLYAEWWPIGNPLVIVAHTPDGEARSLTDDEAAGFQFRGVCVLRPGERARPLALPVLEYVPQLEARLAERARQGQQRTQEG
jgi:hypothetical protein